MTTEILKNIDILGIGLLGIKLENRMKKKEAKENKKEHQTICHLVLQ